MNMKCPTAKALSVATLSALLILLFFVLRCGSSASPSPQLSIARRSRRLLWTPCRDANSCSTPVSGFRQFFKAPATVFESLKKMPKSSGSLRLLVYLVQDRHQHVHYCGGQG
uniref:Secreted protein n=1 Tax=Zea mays TaxID=4577 RepID=A0A804LX76_MAIZE